MFSYPDLVAICGEAKYNDERRDIVLKPIVSSRSCPRRRELFDRGENFAVINSGTRLFVIMFWYRSLLRS